MDILFGTKVYDTVQRQIAILIKTYKLGYVDAPNAMGAHILSPEGKKYSQNMDNLKPVSDMSNEEISELNIPASFLVD